jgi:hypothetical protein
MINIFSAEFETSISGDLVGNRPLALYACRYIFTRSNAADGERLVDGDRERLVGRVAQHHGRVECGADDQVKEISASGPKIFSQTWTTATYMYTRCMLMWRLLFNRLNHDNFFLHLLSTYSCRYSLNFYREMNLLSRRKYIK